MLRAVPLNDPETVPDFYWATTAPPATSIDAFEGGRLAADVVIIGAGFTGLSAGLHLAERGIDVLVIDAKEPGWGASGRNNGQVVAALKHEPHEIEKAFGEERGRQLIDAIGNAPNMVFGLIEKYGIECGARRRGIITAAHSPLALSNLQRRTEAWQARGVGLSMLSREEMEGRSGSSYYLGGCFDPRGGALNPLALSRGLAKAILSAGGRLRKNALVKGITSSGGQHVLELANGSIAAKKVVIATNGYTGDFWPGLKKTFIPVRTPQLVTAPLDPDLVARILPRGEAMSDLRRLVLGVRVHPDNRLHLGGGGGTSGSDREGQYSNMLRLCRQVFPFLKDVKWEFRWTGFMAMTPDYYPRLFELGPGIVAALGYSGRGIGTGTLLGHEIAKWVACEARLLDLALPLSSFRELPYYPIKELLVEAAIKYYDARDRFVHYTSHRN